MKNENFEAIYEKAWAAGVAAATAIVPRPMAVQSVGLFGKFVATKPYDVVSEGCCGFAWVWFKGNTPFGRWAKKTGKARPSYPTGLQMWISAYNQSVTRKYAHAQAMAEVLQEAGIEAYAQDRLD